MFTKFIMEATVIFLRSLERQPFIVLLLLGALAASGWWNWEMRKDFRAESQATKQATKQDFEELRQSIIDCDSARTNLAIRVAVLEALAAPPPARRSRK